MLSKNQGASKGFWYPLLRVGAAAVAVALMVLPGHAQTYRGAINGSVIDPSGAVVPNAQVKAKEKSTGIEHSTSSTSDGQFALQDLPVGMYSIIVTAAGFPVLTVDNILVGQGSVYTLPVKLALSQQATTVEVSAAALTLDTTSETQTTLVTGADLQALPLNGRDFTQMIAVAPGFGGYSAGGFGSVNGTRANQVNWQIDGVDNNDLWHNVPAVNQGGVLGIAGIVLPVDSIDQFSVQTQAAPESGRNPGGTVDLALKSGGNDFHGTAYYFIRNEAFAAASPFSDTKKENRNQQYGFSVGGPFIKDRLFFFATFEKQRFTIGLPGLGTEPSTAYQAAALDVLKNPGGKYGAYAAVTPNPVTTALIGHLLPSYAVNGPATPNNYSSPDPEYGYSYNGLAKIDFKINDKNSFSFHYFIGQGNQVAPVGSQIKDYYEVAPIHVSNYAASWNSTLSPRLSNQLLAGVNYFRQIFSDFNTNFNLAGDGLNLYNGFNLAGAPNIEITGFDPIGLTPPEGREDITGHLTDVASYTVGKHQFRFGGEFRRAQLEEFYHRHALGNFIFDGSQGPWASNTSIESNVLALADFLAGDVFRSSIAVGDPTRLVFVKTFALFAQDAWQVSQKLSLNYGLRWDYEGPLGNDKKNLSVFVPSKGGVVFQGAGLASVYPKDYRNFSPRVGFAYKLGNRGDLVVRGGFGVYFDTPNLNPFLDNRPGNGAPNGLEGNPAGPTPVQTIPANGITIQSGVPVFGPTGTSCITGNGCGQVFNLFSVSQNFRTPYSYNYNLNIEKTLGSSLLLQVGYVGSSSHRLMTTADINQPAPGIYATDAAQQAARPYFAKFPDFGVINEIEANGNANYNSLQTVLKVHQWHRFTGQFTYTWAHGLDDMTQYRGTLPQNSFNLKADYGNMDYDTRHKFTATLDYDLPSASRYRLLLNGWSLNSLLAFGTGQPFTVFSSEDTTGTGEGEQRANQIGNPFAGLSHAFNKNGVTWLNPSAFADPAPGTFGTSPRNGYYGPGYGSVDFSVVKSTRVTERISTQFRIEMFNLFNRTNLAPPSGTNGSGLGITADTIGDWNGAPGLGPGEAFNMQLGLKIIF
ncbi:MAG TPA: carboxypeptidase regulatory-like domain-containing protein [Candidatus Acidoferrum sp.]|nr:carboxypeptidase regulatory-like domain-containing protein [Candidatus Acidoferrum sp.]